MNSTRDKLRRMAGYNISPITAILLVVLFFCLMILASLFWPCCRPRESARKATCQSNLKEIALSFQMYMSDYNGRLPSSVISGAPERGFRSTMGKLPPPTTKGYKAETIYELLYPYYRNKDIIYCPMDATAFKTHGFLWWKKQVPVQLYRGANASYVLKKAINDAWLDPKIKARRETDYKWPAEQLLFYERRSFHWGDTSGDLSDPGNRKKIGASANCAFMDGHVKTHRIPDQFEPDYYNTDGNTGSAVKQPQINPRVYCDRLL